MPEMNFRIRSAVLAICFCAIIAGCDKNNSADADRLKFGRDDDEPKIIIPPHIAGTVGEYAVLAGGRVAVEAYGVVDGLGKNGSSEVPTRLRRSVSDYLTRVGLGSPRLGTQHVTPSRVLRDKDTAVVRLTGILPAGAPVGTRFDVFVSSLPNTQTISLDGGLVLPIELRIAFGNNNNPNRLTKPLGRASGAVFVNPFIDPTKPGEMAKLKLGRVIGGGMVGETRPIRLHLRTPDYLIADRIQRAIIHRFSHEQEPILAKVAKARNRSIIDVRIPQEYRGDYAHFLRLVLHLPIRFYGGTPDSHARFISERMEMPTANHDGLSLVWESMGRQVLPVVQKLYSSTNPSVAYHSARTGLRLGDRLAEDVIQRFATSENSPFQAPAIIEFGRNSQIYRTIKPLRKLLNSTNERVRLAAYEALRRRGDTSVVETIKLTGRFSLDLVHTTGPFTIYATRTLDSRIVLFGRNMAVRHPGYFESPGEMLTINARADSNTMSVFRKIPRSGGFSDTFEIDYSVRSLVKLLGTVPDIGLDGKVYGLGLTYSQVVSTLYRMCKEDDIPAKFILQPAPGMQRIYGSPAAVGRPDMPSQ